MALQKILLDVEMIDGTIHEDIRVIVPDMIRHTEVAQRHKWPTNADDDPMRAAAFYAYAAMTRLGIYPKDKGFDDFVNEVAMIESEGMTDEVNP